MSSIFAISKLRAVLEIKDRERQLEKVATEFEAVFLQELLSELSSTEDNPFFSPQTRFWENLYFAQLGEKLAEAGGIGLKKYILEAFKKNAG